MSFSLATGPGLTIWQGIDITFFSNGGVLSSTPAASQLPTIGSGAAGTPWLNGTDINLVGGFTPDGPTLYIYFTEFDLAAFNSFDLKNLPTVGGAPGSYQVYLDDLTLAIS